MTSAINNTAKNIALEVVEQSYVNSMYEIISRITSLFPRLEQSQKITTSGHKNSYLDLAKSANNSFRTSGVIQSILGVAGPALQMSTPLLPAALHPAITALAPNFSTICSFYPNGLQAKGQLDDKLANLHHISLQGGESNKQSNESLKQATQGLLQTFHELLNRTSHIAS